MSDAVNATHEVIRSIPGMDLKAGDLVDASLWRNTEKMVRTRYLRPITDVVVANLRTELVRAQQRIDQLEQENRKLREGGGRRAAAR